MKSVWIMVEGAVREDGQTPELDAVRLHAASEWTEAGAAGGAVWPDGGTVDSCLPEPVRMLTNSTLARGAAALFGWPVDELPPVDADGGMERVPLARWVDALHTMRTLVIYVSAPDRGGWFGNGRQTPASLEAIDREVIKPLKECLEALRPYRMVCTPLPGPECDAVHELTAPMFAAGEGIHVDDASRWNAESCRIGRLGWENSERIATYMEDN